MAVVDRFGRLVLTIAWRILGDDDEASDVYQETFLSYLATLRDGGRIDHPKAWLCRTATNAAFQRLRVRARHRRADPATPVPPEGIDIAVERQLMANRIRELAADLPERQRQVFALRNFHDLSFAQIAEILSCSEEAARASEHKALEKLRAWMRE